MLCLSYSSATWVHIQCNATRSAHSIKCIWLKGLYFWVWVRNSFKSVTVSYNTKNYEKIVVLVASGLKIN